MTPPVMPQGPVTPAPSPLPDAPLLERLWTGLTSPDIHAQLRSGKLTAQDLDENVAYYTGGKITSFKQLAQVRMMGQRVSGEQDVQSALDPGRGWTAAASLAKGGSLNLAEKLAAISPKGSLARGDLTEAARFAQSGEERYPWTAAGASTVGENLPAAAAGGAAVKAAEPLISKLPIGALLKMMTRGAVAGGAGGATAAYGDQPGIKPDPKQMLPAAGIGAGAGAALAVPGWWLATKLNPMEHLASRAVMESAPGDMPSSARGVRALSEGSTSPQVMGPPGKEIVFQGLSREANQALPEPLRQINGELSPKLRVEAGKYLVNSPEAINKMRLGLYQKMQRLRTGTREIERGYGPVLDARALSDAEINQLPLGTQRAMNQLQTPTARDLFTRLQSLRDRSGAIFDAREAGTLSDVSQLGTAHEMSDEAGAIREWMGDRVDGFNEMQEKVAPWLQREEQLRIARRQIVGRAIKALGKSTSEPKGGLAEGVKELTGFEKRLISDRAARRFADVLLSDDVHDLFKASTEPELREFVPDLLRAAPVAGGVTAYESKRHLKIGR